MLYTFNSDTFNALEASCNKVFANENASSFYKNGAVTRLCAEMVKAMNEANAILGRVQYNGLDESIGKHGDLPAVRILNTLTEACHKASKELYTVTSLITVASNIYDAVYEDDEE